MLRHVLSLRGTRSRGISQLSCQRIQEHLLPTMEQQSHAQGSLGTLQHWGSGVCLWKPTREAKGVQRRPEPRAQASRCCPRSLQNPGSSLLASPEPTDTLTPTSLPVKHLCSPWTNQLSLTMFWRDLRCRQEPQYSFRVAPSWGSNRTVWHIYQLQNRN